MLEVCLEEGSFAYFEASSNSQLTRFATAIDDRRGPVFVEIQGESLYQKSKGIVMRKSEFQNSGPDLGLSSSYDLASAFAPPSVLELSDFLGASAFGSRSGLRATSTFLLGGKARMTSYKQLKVNEFGDCGFEIVEEL